MFDMCYLIIHKADLYIYIYIYALVVGKCFTLSRLIVYEFEFKFNITFTIFLNIH